jgi:hypothetical protein
MEMLRHCRKTGDHEIPQPPNTNAAGAANAVQGDRLAEQAFHQGAVFCVNHPVSGLHDELATSRLALVILLAVVNMAIFLEALGATLRTHLSPAQGHLQSSTRHRSGSLVIHTMGP